MKPLLEQLDRITDNVLLLRNFFFKTYPDLLDDRRAFINVDTDEPKLYLLDAALAGHVLGKDGWTRSAAYSKYNWTRDFTVNTATLQVIIVDAELIETQDKTPVPPRIFPLALKEEAEYEPMPADREASPSDDDIPF